MSRSNSRGSAPRHSCPACHASTASPGGADLGLEPTAFERELAHAPGCPRRARETRAKRCARVLILATLPALGIPACAPNLQDAGTSVGLDNGTVGRAQPAPNDAPARIGDAAA